MLRFGRIARIARFALAAILLLAGQAALVHPVSHVDEAGALVHAGHGHDRSGEELCGALDALTACVPGAAPLVVAAPSIDEVVAAPAPRAPRRAESPPFLSQGPPTLL
jgi:hypothetical protein